MLGLLGVWLGIRSSSSDPDERPPADLSPAGPGTGGRSGPRPEVAALIAEANEVCDRLVKRFPHAPESHDVKGWALFRFGNSSEAVKSWRKCVELDSTFGSAYYWMGRCAFDREDYALAADSFRKALELEPGSAVYPLYLANALMRLAQFEEAVAVLQRDLKARPAAMPSYVLLGQAHLHLRQYQEAKQSLEKAIAIAPDYTSAYYTLATACDRLGEKEKAKEYHARFRRLKERDHREERESLKRYDDTAEVRQGVARVYALAARVYDAHGEAAEAESHRRRAAELEPTSPQGPAPQGPAREAGSEAWVLPGLEALPAPEPARR